MLQLCRGGEQLCVRVVEEEANYEYRGCWDDDYDIEYARPGRGRYCAAAGGDIVTGDTAQAATRGSSTATTDTATTTQPSACAPRTSEGLTLAL